MNIVSFRKWSDLQIIVPMSVVATSAKMHLYQYLAKSEHSGVQFPIATNLDVGFKYFFRLRESLKSQPVVSWTIPK